MKIAGIIAEFNPLHKGHLLPIQAARKAVGGDGAVVCIMSGNCVQRGDLAAFHKSARAKAAIAVGADLVIELPIPYVLGSAEPFARGGVSLLQAFGQPDISLVFGCERADKAALVQAARALDKPSVQEAVRAKMAQGHAYGTACQAALDEEGKSGHLLRTPNNLLGLEYLRAMHHLDAKITALPISRQGVAHDSGVPEGEYASATYLRNLLYAENTSQAWRYMPKAASEIFQAEQTAGRGPTKTSQLEQTILTLLRIKKPPEEGYLDDSEGLSIRIRNVAAQAGSLAELQAQAKTKRYHSARIRRAVLKMCLSLTPTDRPCIPPYIRPLAANETGRVLLRQLKKTAQVPIISRAAEARKQGSGVERMMEIEADASDLLANCYKNPSERRGGSEWRLIPGLT